MYSERFYYIKWLINPKNWVNLILWIVNRITYFILRKDKRLKFFLYPHKVRVLSKNIINSYKKSFKHKKVNKKNSNFKFPKLIKLASKNFKTRSDGYFWDIKFNDPEDTMSLHRWNFLVEFISLDRLDIKQIQNHKNLIISWVGWSKNSNSKNLLVWNTYTISERLVNATLFFRAIEETMDKELKKILYDQTIFLIKNLEYNASHTGNHIINNARALYIVGIELNELRFIDLSLEILNESMSDIFRNDGFLREGSSHYQLLVTKWFCELVYFSELSANSIDYKYFSSHFIKIYNASKFFIFKKVKKSIPLFGDVSPDFSPNFLINLLFEEKNNFYSKIIDDFFKKNNKKKKTRYNKKKSYFIKSKGIDEWYRFNNEESTLFLRFPSNGRNDFTGHYHNDLMHFFYSFNNVPIFIDLGRIDYESRSMCESLSHNSLVIRELGLIPEGYYGYPKGYGETENIIRHNYSNNQIQVFLKSNGFSRIKKNIKYNRKFIIRNNEFSVIDSLNISDNSSSTLNFYFSPYLSIRILNSSTVEVISKDSSEKFLLFINRKKINPYTLKIMKTAASESYGSKIQSNVLVIKNQGSFKQELKLIGN
jgi:hypothetical protein